jgi:hypothetical protein
MTEDRSTGGLALPAVPPATAREQPGRFSLTGCSVRLSNLKLPPLGIPPPSGGGGCQVGATARVYDEPVLTRNADDFAPLGVEVESY